jgi:hypothetical protein
MKAVLSILSVALLLISTPGEAQNINCGSIPNEPGRNIATNETVYRPVPTSVCKSGLAAIVGGKSGARNDRAEAQMLLCIKALSNARHHSHRREHSSVG